MVHLSNHKLRQSATSFECKNLVKGILLTSICRHVYILFRHG